APGIDLLAFDLRDVRRQATEINRIERLFAIMHAHAAVRLDANRFAGGAEAAQALGIVGVHFRVAANGFKELVEIRDDGILRDDERVRPEIGDLRLPIKIHALYERDDGDDRTDADGDAEQR